MKEFKVLPKDDYNHFNDFQKNQFYQTIFIDEFILTHAIYFYNNYMGYREHPIDRDEALAYANIGTRINAEFFRTIHPRNEEELNIFYKITPFHFFNNIVRFMDGMHTEMALEFHEKFSECSVLDFAGGTGGFSIFFASKSMDVTFVESNLISLSWMRYISKVLNLKINIVGGNEKIDRKFDLIIAKDVIEHVVDPGKLMEYLQSLLNENGKLFITHYPCCGPDETAPFHFKVDGDSGNLSSITYNLENNLAQLSGKAVSSNTSKV